MGYGRARAAILGVLGRSAEVENLAQTLATAVTNLEIDPRVGSAAIAGLVVSLPDPETELGSLTQPFIALSAAAQDAEGRPDFVGDVEHQIVAAAELLSGARRVT